MEAGILLLMAVIMLANSVEKMRNGIKVHNNPCDIDTSRIRTIDGSWSKVYIEES